MRAVLLQARETRAAGGAVYDPITGTDATLAGKWGFGAKMAAAGLDRLKLGLKRGDWAW